MVVLSNNDGCVIARSAEAKVAGIAMGEPFFKQKELFRRAGVVCFSSNYELYADMSSRVMTTLEEMSPRVEIYSIDEAFCDLTGVRNCRDLTEFGKEIRATVLQRTHLTVGVGIAQTKTLAKLANHAAKNGSGRLEAWSISNVDRQRRLMALVPVEDVWGVGRRISKKLNAMGIKPHWTSQNKARGLSVNTLTLCWSEPSGSCAASHAGSGGVRPGKAGNCMQPIVWRTYY